MAIVVPETPREIALWTIMSYHGTWYSWGGDDPSGFDCSGVAVEALKAADILPRGGDWSAEALFNVLLPPEEPSKIIPGHLAFWKTREEKIIHVEMVITPGFSIGASGGGSRTITKEDAIRDNAFIKIRPIVSSLERPLAGYRDPFREV